MVSLRLASGRKEDEGTEDLELDRFGSDAGPFSYQPWELCELVPYSFPTNVDSDTLTPSEGAGENSGQGLLHSKHLGNVHSFPFTSVM